MVVMRLRPLHLTSWRRTGPAAWAARAAAAAGGRRSRLGRGAVTQPLPAAASEAVVAAVAAAADRIEAAAAAAPIHALASRTRRRDSRGSEGSRARRVAATPAMMAGGPPGTIHRRTCCKATSRRRGWYWSRVTMARDIFSESVSRRPGGPAVAATLPTRLSAQAEACQSATPLQSRAGHGLVLRRRSRPRSRMPAFSSRRFGSTKSGRGASGASAGPRRRGTSSGASAAALRCIRVSPAAAATAASELCGSAPTQAAWR
jgi:hypothetical protein